MIKAPTPVNESGRIQALQDLKTLDTPKDPALDAITEAIEKVSGCPIVLVSLVDTNRHWFSSAQRQICGGLVKVIAAIEDPSVITQILKHLSKRND